MYNLGVCNNAESMMFSITDFFSNWIKPHFLADLVTLTEEILNRKNHILYNVNKSTKCLWVSLEV